MFVPAQKRVAWPSLRADACAVNGGMLQRIAASDCTNSEGATVERLSFPELTAYCQMKNGAITRTLTVQR